MKNVFNINSDFMIIWKTTFSAFNICFVFIFFLKYVLMELSGKNEDETEESSKIIFLYNMINIMFFFELIFSVLIIIFNGGSTFTYLKLPLKIYNAIPFKLKKENLVLLIPKFFRIDLFEKLFSLIEMFINSNILYYIQNYYFKIFLTYTIDMFKYLLIFFLYAHCLCCFLCYYDDLKEIQYISGLYYTIQAFTTIGFGEISPKSIGDLMVMILTLFLSVNFMSVITSNIRYLSFKMKEFFRETSFNQQFEFLIFKIQKSTGKLFPSHLKKLMQLFLLFRRGIAYSEIKMMNKKIFDICRYKVVKEIDVRLFNYLKEDFSIYFQDCEDDFIFKIFECMIPKMFKANKTLIEYNQKVKGLYFLMNGNIFIYNKYNKPVYSVMSNNLFGEYEFITNSRSDYIVKVHPRMAAYGFLLKKSDWEDISKQYITSAKKFIETIVLRKSKHNEWILYSLNNNKNEEIINIEKKNAINDESTITISSNNSLVNNIYDEENKNNNFSKNDNKNINKDLIIPVKKRNENYNINNQKIILKIEEVREQLKFLENKLILFKKGILKNIKFKNN